MKPRAESSPFGQPLAVKRSALRRWGRRVLFASILWALLHFAAPWLFPLPKDLLQPVRPSILVTDRHGISLRNILESGRYRTQPLPLEKIPADLIDCTLAAEDARFWHHGGIDYLATGRAVRDALWHREIVSGASTVTQQLVKVSSPPARRNLITKVREALTARRVEMTWDKKRILQEYLNRIEYGNLCRGCAAAAEYYFQKPLADLSLSECALLAGLPQAPSRLNPLKNHAGAIKRRDWVLDRLALLHPSKAREVQRAKNETLALRPLQDPFSAGHVVDLMLEEKTVAATVRTTLDASLQKAAERILAEELNRLSVKEASQGAVIVLDNATGEILAMVGSADYRSAQWNAALARRSAGSTLKPFTYMLALEKGWHPGTILADVPSHYLGSSGLIDVVNYDRKYRGPITLRESLGNSLNVPVVRLLNDLGGPTPLHQALCQAGFSTLEEKAQHYGLGLTIGNAEIRLLDLATAYAALARLGAWMPSRLLPDATTESSRQLCRPETAWLLADILSDNAARSAAFGAESQLRLPFRCASKTGTSTDFRDNWCVGFTRDFTVAVWVGNFDNRPMKGVSGVTGAGPVFHALMLELASRKAPAWLERPATIIEAEIDTRTGHLLTGVCEPVPGFHRREFFAPFSDTRRQSLADYDDAGRPLLADGIFSEWMQRPGDLRNRFALASSVRTNREAPVIHSPLHHATYLLDPELPGGGKWLDLRSSLGTQAHWRSETLAIDTFQQRAELIPGKHQVCVSDPATGLESWVSITVEQR